MTSRRNFLEHTLRSGVGLSILGKSALGPRMRTSALAGGFVDIVRPPDRIEVQTETATVALEHHGERWTTSGAGSDIVVETLSHPDALRVTLAAPKTAIKRLHLRWRAPLDSVRLILGDAWERGYGDLEWRGWIPDRVM